MSTPEEREPIVDMMASMLADDAIVAAVRSGTHRLVARDEYERLRIALCHVANRDHGQYSGCHGCAEARELVSNIMREKGGEGA